ncbi:MAG: hypothetical protein Tsb0014_43080 [Pleurocapsa sp.]
MPLIKQTLIIDLITTFWIVAIFIVLFLLLPIKTSYIAPQKINQKPADVAEFNAQKISYSSSQQQQRLQQNQIVGVWLRITFFTITGVLVLSAVHLLNWMILTLLYVTGLIFNYLESHHWQIARCRHLLQTRIFSLVDVLDQGLSFSQVIKNIIYSCQAIQQRFTNNLNNLARHQGIFFVAILTVVLTFAAILRWEYPLLELRFSHPDRYGVLLITRQILAGNSPEIDYLPVFPAWSTIVSLLGSIDAMEVVRVLGPILGIIMVLSVGYVVRVLTQNATAALIAMLCLGVYLFTWEQDLVTELPLWLTRIIGSLNSSLVRQWTGNELELGVTFLLLGLGYFFDCDLAEGEALRDRKYQKTTRFKLNLICGIILVAISAPALLIIVAVAGLTLIGDRKLTLMAISLAWIVLAVFAATTPERLLWTQSFLLTLPIPLSLLAGWLFDAIARFSQLISKKWGETFCLALILSLSLNFLLPLSPNLTYLEYDMAARKSLEIKNLFPSQTWTIAAPVEQLAEIYGAGGYQDLALFVENNAPSVDDPNFKFPVTGEHLFIYVEKIPFITFPNEPSIIPNDILGDRTYRYYRSSAGRTSLEYEALQMCETYLRHHPNSDIYYEDRELKIYHFQQS